MPTATRTSCYPRHAGRWPARNIVFVLIVNAIRDTPRAATPVSA
jgi:hypothetical protein